MSASTPEHFFGPPLGGEGVGRAAGINPPIEERPIQDLITGNDFYAPDAPEGPGWRRHWRKILAAASAVGLAGAAVVVATRGGESDSTELALEPAPTPVLAEANEPVPVITDPVVIPSPEAATPAGEMSLEGVYTLKDLSGLEPGVNPLSVTLPNGTELLVPRIDGSSAASLIRSTLNLIAVYGTTGDQNVAEALIEDPILREDFLYDKRAMLEAAGLPENPDWQLAIFGHPNAVFTVVEVDGQIKAELTSGLLLEERTVPYGTKEWQADNARAFLPEDYKGRDWYYTALIFTYKKDVEGNVRLENVQFDYQPVMAA